MVIDRETRKTWTEHLRRVKEAGVDRQEYCRQHGIREHQLRYWSGRLAMVSPSKPKTRPFVRAVVEQPRGKGEAISTVAARLVLANCSVLEFTSEADPAWIGRVAREVTQ